MWPARRSPAGPHVHWDVDSAGSQFGDHRLGLALVDPVDGIPAVDDQPVAGFRLRRFQGEQRYPVSVPVDILNHDGAGFCRGHYTVQSACAHHSTSSISFITVSYT